MITDVSPPITRLAPSPTGVLHLGNARTFLINWAMARQAGWKIVLRMEDIDGPRIKAASDQQAIEILQWLGMDWDDGPTYQSHDLQPYRDALERLADQGWLYPCEATRKDLESAQSAPHGDQHELRYPGTHRNRAGGPRDDWPSLLEDDRYAWRVVVPDELIEFTDTQHGQVSVNVQQQVGDFVVATKLGLPSYQLAVVVDDARQGVTHVVRGDDLLRSTARQVLLYRMLGLGALPTYTHVPLVLGEDGRRLAKRHGDTRLIKYRDQGIDPHRVIGLIGAWCGLCDDGECELMDARTFAERFDINQLPGEPVVMTQEDEAWLTQS